MPIAILALGNTNCSGTNPSAPKIFEPRQYSTDSATQQVFRSSDQGLEQISTNDPRFDEMTAVWTHELVRHKQELEDISWKCEKWKQ